MKTSMVLLALIILNTSALLSKSIAEIVKGMDTWPLLVLEIILLIALYANNMLKGLNEISKVDLNGIDLFVPKQKDKTQGPH